MADFKLAYPSSTALTVTNLHSIASSSTFVSGWTSGTIDNSSNLYLDYFVTASIVVASGGLSNGQIRMYAYAQLNDSTWPDIFSAGTEGTEGTATLHDVNIRDGVLKSIGAILTDTTNSQVYPLGFGGIAAAFDGFMPRKFAIYIAHSTGANLAASSNGVWYTPKYITG